VSLAGRRRRHGITGRSPDGQLGSDGRRSSDVSRQGHRDERHELVETLQGKGPFTVFAPTNEAFAALPAGAVDNLLKPENKSALAKVLTYHVVAGDYDAAALEKLIRKGNGTAQLKTVSGGTLWFMMNGPMNVVVKDEAGHVADISTYDVRQSNGVIQVVDRVLMPAM
jgi:uncharacterized surface protein with fasciclin (FAS1) repeats